MEYKNIICEVRGRIFHITLNRPEKLNALSRELMMELDTAIDESKANDDISVIVIKGSGKAFSAAIACFACLTGSA